MNDIDPVAAEDLAESAAEADALREAGEAEVARLGDPGAGRAGRAASEVDAAAFEFVFDVIRPK